jgi:hypothetical protein
MDKRRLAICSAEIFKLAGLGERGQKASSPARLSDHSSTSSVTALRASAANSDSLYRDLPPGQRRDARRPVKRKPSARGTHRRGLLVIVPKHGNTVSQSMKGQCLLERFVSLPSPTIDRRSAACGHGVSSLAARRWSRPPIRPTWLAPSHTNTDVANSASGRAEWRLTRCLRCQRRSISKKYSIVLLD